ncbi:recombinase family protein [Paracoccus versutus]|uniref:recombinase family protein n=1 Tax=Paracoccus versutus TaxID=34007 RepID=UPI001FB71B07|nr:recombinase family protein [Paracoccus versutus]MCJ1903192.1 recombinase family protein [Paracoccus versutus]
MTKAYSYVRWSSDAQTAGDSLRRQQEASAKYAMEHGLELVTDFDLTDAGISAFKGLNAKEGALKTFLDAVNSGKVEDGSYLLVEALDRLSRQDVWTAFSQLSAIVNAGINVVTVSDGRIYSKESAANNFADLIIAISVMIRANDESLRKSQRVGAAWKNKRENAAREKLTVMCPNWMELSPDRTRFILHDDHVQTIKRIFDDCIGGKGVRIITAALNREKVPTYGRSSNWAESTIKKILSSRAVLGEYQPHRKVDGKRIPDGEPVKDYYPRIIDEETFNLAQAAIRSRQQGAAGRKGKNMSNLFSGLAKCGYCGGTMRYLDKGPLPKGGKYLVCMNSQNGMGCVNKTWSYPKFERVFLTFVRELDLRSLVGGVKAADEAKQLSDGIRARQEAITSNKEKIDNYFAQLEANPALSEMMLERANVLAQENQTLEAQIKERQTKLQALEASGLEVSDGELAKIIEIFQSGQGNRFVLADRIRSLVERIDVKPDGPQIPAWVDGDVAEGIDKNPSFSVKLRNRDVQVVVVDRNDPTKLLQTLAMNIETREKKYHLFRGAEQV